MLKTRPSMSPWDLKLVIRALVGSPFEPLESVDLKWFSFKVDIFLTLATAKRVGELHALLVHEHLCRFLPEGAGVVLRPNPAVLSKVLAPSQPGQETTVGSLFSESEGGDHRCSLMCPVRALMAYVRRTQDHRQTDQLSKAHLSHWIVTVINRHVWGLGVPFPSGIRAHATQGVPTYWALWRGTSLEICAVTSYSKLVLLHPLAVYLADLQ